MSMFNISSLFEKTYNKVVTVGIADSAFRATRICPLNPNIFPDHLFTSSLVTSLEENSDNMEVEFGNSG